jgi:diguanylate cyclase (GGDEF)-like protein
MRAIDNIIFGMRRSLPITALYLSSALVLSCVALVIVGWGLQYSGDTRSSPDVPLQFSYLHDATGRWEPEQAFSALSSSVRLVSGFATNRSEEPFWLLADLAKIDGSNSVVFPSRHARRLECWIAELQGVKSAGDGASAMLTLTSVPVRPSGTGFALDLASPGPGSLLCKALFVGPARASLLLQDEQSLDAAEHQFERAGGLLFGSLLMLAGFSAVVAVVSRESTFLYFALWIILNLRIAAVSTGWGFAWLGVSPEFELVFRQISLGAYSLVSALLFRSLFASRIEALKMHPFLTAAIGLACLIAFASLILPYRLFLPFMWATAVLGILLLGSMLARICIHDPTPIAGWYALGWGVSIFGIFGEIVRAASNQVFEVPGLNQATGAVLSALLTGVALAHKLTTERQQRVAAQSDALYALDRFRENYEATPVGLFSMRFDGTVLEYNPAFAAMFGLPPPEQYQQQVNWIKISSHHAFDSLIRLTCQGKIADTEIAIPSSQSGRRWLHLRALLKRDRIETWIEDITARKEAERRLQFLADHDSLTGLLNRRGVNGHLERAIATSGERSVCFAYIDLDRFKLVNDLFGHAAGDQILRQLSTRTREVIHPPHVVARVGGDEFVVIVNGLDLEASRALCEELRRALSDRSYQHHDKALSVAASIGLIRLNPQMSPRDALTASDRACAEAKRAGGSSVVAFDSGNSELSAYLDEIRLVANMRERLPVENFFTQMQPIVSLRNPYSSLCYEVLVRLREPSGAIIPPARFITAAERNGLMSQIDRWVLRSTLEWLDANPAHRDAVGFCTVNLSGASLNDQRFLEDTISLIRTHSDATQKICFEITESVALYDLNATRRFVDRVKSFGARVALDDFGAGYTSFSYLKELPGDLLKIDGSLVRDINLNPANFAITSAIVDLAHEIGMACVAEWAENAEIVRSLIELNVDYAQGYGLSRPLDTDRLLNATHCVDLIQDPKVVELLGPNRPSPVRRGRASVRRPLLSP